MKVEGIFVHTTLAAQTGAGPKGGVGESKSEVFYV